MTEAMELMRAAHPGKTIHLECRLIRRCWTRRGDESSVTFTAYIIEATADGKVYSYDAATLDELCEKAGAVKVPRRPNRADEATADLTGDGDDGIDLDIADAETDAEAQAADDAKRRASETGANAAS